jgi:BirA family transcriptional regulator, biotin operon repressor / biotin---[acetyl-CoA-carboxylase] ligase
LAIGVSCGIRSTEGSLVRSELDLERALAAAGLRAPVRWEEVTGSTNATAYELAMGGAPEWTLVAAGHQTAGRGRLGRVWEDVAGRALLCSIVLRPSVPPEDAGLLTLLAGAAWAETAREVAGVDATTKWPNDLLVGEAKAGGVLAESRMVEDRLDVVILGSGINLVPPEIEGPFAGLGAGVDPVDLLAGFLVRFRAGYEVESARLADEVRVRWRSVAATLGRDVEAARADGVPIRGRAVDVDARGGLILDTPDGLSVVAFGEVVHLT